jgi:two-component system cell cycle sensor histidine kinase/response regulator CckA
MLTAAIAIALLAGVACAAIAIAYRATAGARAAREALRASEAKYRETAERAKTMEGGSRLAGDVAHDLNDLLTAITGHTELLIASLDPSTQAVHDAIEIRRAALSAARLTRSLRTLGAQRASSDVIDVNAVTARTVESLQRMLGRDVEVSLALDDSIGRVKLDASQLEEIVLNLGVHARDMMPGGGRLKVATTMHQDEGRSRGAGAAPAYVRLIVADTSGGMSEAARARMFEPFFASGETGDRAMGLAKVDAIVKQAGGRIQVESAAGVGTTFLIDLPATSEPAAAPEPSAAEMGLAAPVLVVEDEPRVRELIRLVLVRAGYEVVAVAEPHAALAALHRQPSMSMMLVDVVIPEMDGYALVEEARKVAPDVRVVFMSGFALDPTRHPAGVGFLAKPFTVESLVGIVKETLGSR